MKALRLMAVVAASAWALPARAADEPRVAAPVYGAAPLYADPGVGEGCATCGASGPTVGCSTCGKLLRGHARFGHKNTGPFQVNLCPGACFGYFQTQWRKWEDVCPYPYIGHGVTDSPRRPTPSALPRPGGPGGELTPPRPIDPKMGEPKKMPAPPGGLPPIPGIPDPMPKSKFGP
jgi:hypothetical protein